MALPPVVREYATAFLVSAVIVSVPFAVTFADPSESLLSSINVGLAAGTLFLLGVVLLLGPLMRMFTVFDRAFVYRKELGIMSFVTGLIHVYLVMFPLARNGPFGLYVSRPYSAYPGIVALGVLTALLLLSNRFAERKLGVRWWEIQYWGARLTFVLIAIHMIVLKYRTIFAWFTDPRGSGGILPPLIIFETLFIAFVVAVRLADLLKGSRARTLSKVSFGTVVLILIWGTYFR